MSKQFFYIQLKFTPKTGNQAVPITRQREAVVEVPRYLVQRKQAGAKSENSGQESIALDLARRVAFGAFPTAAERIPVLYDEDPPTWREDRPYVMNERVCDYEENGTRAWRIA
jgi:hypothetical protein